jgi:hypothetical protein
MEKSKFLFPPGIELRPLGRPAPSQSLYRLRYLVVDFKFYNGAVASVTDHYLKGVEERAEEFLGKHLGP